MPDKVPEENEYKIEKAEPLKEETDTPAYMTQLELNEDQKKRLSVEIFKEKNAIDDEREKAHLVEKWDALDNQYDGKPEENIDQQFNVHWPITAIKTDSITHAAKKAFLEADPTFSVSPRPEYAREGGLTVCEGQQDYLDYKLDEGEIPFKAPMGKVFHSAVLKDGGILKITHRFATEERERRESYKGNPKYEQDPRTSIPVLVSNDGLQEFLNRYPDAPTKYPAYVNKLEAGKEIEIVVKYEETTYNDPYPKYVPLKNFGCRLATEGYEGLKHTRLIYEKMSYTWWELKKEEKEGKFSDIDELKYEYDKGKKRASVKGDGEVLRQNYESETFNVFECVFWFSEKESDTERRIVCWIEEESRKVIGAIRYPYDTIDCYYVPFFISHKKEGFYQTGVGERVTDINIAGNAFLNLLLGALYMRNMITPVTKDQDVLDQFLERSWTHGLPIIADPGTVDFLQKYMAHIDVKGMITIVQFLERAADDVTKVSSYTTGRESALDPEAPARKTLALMRQSSENVGEYIAALNISFNEVAHIILQMTAQITKDSRSYRPREKTEAVTGENPFKTLTRSDMVARTNIQSQSLTFNIDKQEERQGDLTLFQILRPDPFFQQFPESIYLLMKNIIKGWSPKWRIQADKLLPPLEQFKAGQAKLAAQAVAGYIESKVAESRETGAPLEFDPKQLIAAMSQTMAESVSPPEEKGEQR